MNTEIKERARVKVWSKLENLNTIAKEGNPFWKIEEITVEEAINSLNREYDVWNYIMSLIEKDI